MRPHAGVAIVIGDENGQHVAIFLLHRSRPGTSDYWDGNWIESEVSVSAGGFRGSYRASLRSEELTAFASALKALDQTLAGRAGFETMEKQLRLSLQGDGRGHVAVEGIALDQAGTGNTLQFAFELDQTYLPRILREVEEALAAYPVVGSP